MQNNTHYAIPVYFISGQPSLATNCFHHTAITVVLKTKRAKGAMLDYWMSCNFFLAQLGHKQGAAIGEAVGSNWRGRGQQ